MDRYRRSLSYGYVVMEVDADAAKAVQALDGKAVAGGGQKLKIVYAPIPPLPRK
jgi:hypothetical protein